MSGKTAAQAAIVNYESPIVDRCRVALVTATACLFCFFPLPLICTVFGIGVHGIWNSLLLAASILSLIAFFVAINFYRLNRTTRLILTESGITLPGSFLAKLSTANQLLPWSIIEQISIDTDSAQRQSVLLSLKWRTVRLKLSSMSGDDRDKFVSACMLWSDASCRDDSFLAFASELTGKRIDDSQSSFTGLWMQEANRRLRATPYSPLNPGNKLQDGRVKIVQAVAAGGWSAIYLCQWQEKTAAMLKEAVVPPAVPEELKKKAYEQFERESVLLAGLNHPQIAKILDYFVENGRQYMVLQRIPGPNLRTYIKDKGPVSEKQARKWAREICGILLYLHDREPPIVHRDLTPENLVLDMRGSLVLVDFGSANEFVGTVTGTLVGKPSYVAPEQFSGRATLRSDLYSLGAVLYFMLTGKDPEPLAVAHLNQTEIQVTEQLDKLVADLMCLNVKKRVGSVAEAAQRLTCTEAVDAV